MIPLEALKSKEGAGYLAGAAACFVVATLLVANGILRFLEEETVRAAVAAFHRDAPETHSLLVELKDARPNDPTWRVLLGCLEVERADGDADRLGVAERLFEEALALDPTRRSAVVGRAVARLKLAALKPREGRVQAAKIVADDLDRAGLDAAHPDVVALKAGVELMRGRAAEALKLLDAPMAVVPSRDGQAAWRWNRAVAACMARRGDCLEDACAAYVLRRAPMPQEAPDGGGDAPLHDAARLLSMAYRVALADPAATPTGPEALVARCELAKQAMAVMSPGAGLRGRYRPPTAEEASAANALGMAYARLERWADAAEAFGEARRVAKHVDPTYALNMAEARRQQALALPPEQAKEATRLVQQACEAYGQLCKEMEGQGGREAVRVLAATNGAALYLSVKQPEPALMFYRQHTGDHPNAAERARNLGALFDHNKSTACIEPYRQAISLSHPDAPALERRIRVRSR